ncbi:MAG: ATP-binding protein [Acidimicrobiales bacterium]
MEHNDGDAIRLTVPATSAAVRIARVGAAGLGTRLGFTFTEVEELRLAVGEAAALLCDEGTDATLIVVYDIEPQGLRVTLSLVAGHGKLPHAPHLSDMAAAVLDTVVDEWSVERGGTQVMLRKVPSDHDHDD